MDLPPIAVAASVCVAALAVFASLYVMSARFLYERELHELRTEAHKLRTEYTRRLDALRRAGSGDFDVELVSAGEIGVDILPEEPQASREAA